MTFNIPYYEVIYHVYANTRTINLHSKFEAPKFTRSKDMMWAQLLANVCYILSFVRLSVVCNARALYSAG